MATVCLENLTKAYGRGRTAVPVVHGINLEIRHGEFMVLVGPSGCGKSTTLRMIAGLEEVSGGTIAIGDRRVNDVLPKDRDIAMVFQNYALYPHLTVYENLAFGLRMRKTARREIDERVRGAADVLGLAELLARKPAALSGGQRQRVAVGRALVRQPQVFLFDEPLSNLDAKMRVSMRAELSRLHARLGATMIYVTHDQVEAMSMGDRICVMHAGRIMQVAPPLELYEQPANLFVAGFIGSPPMNFFRGRIQGEASRLALVCRAGPDREVRLPLGPGLARRAAACRDREVVLGIRPEGIRLTPAHAESFPALVEFAEPMGAETLLHVQLDGLPGIARVAPDDRFEPKQRVFLDFVPEKIRFFDAASEQALPG